MLGEVSWPTKDAVPSVRIDTWVASGTEVTANFDPLLAKLMVHGDTRAVAVERIQAALASTVIKGSISNLPYLAKICAFPEFVSGMYDL